MSKLKNAYKWYIKQVEISAKEKELRGYKRLYSSVKLTPAQEREIHGIWKENYGRKISLNWHRLYQSFYHNSIGGGYNKYYFPEHIFETELIHILNPRGLKNCLAEKSLMEFYFSGIGQVKTPKTVLMNCNGYYYNADRRIITRERAKSILQTAGDIVVKPSIDSSSGRLVLFFNFTNQQGDNKLITNPCDLLDYYKQNFIVQERIIQHPSLAKLHDSSVNTIRINTYILDFAVYNSPIAMRIGCGNNRTDNLHAGGISVGIDIEGALKSVAFTKNQRIYYKHPDSEVSFEGYRIPKISHMVEKAKELHGRIPHVGIIAWDMTLDDNENIVVIECNLSYPGIWFPQALNGESFFGENTPKMIAMCRKCN
ncbi:MAG: hypothetical protein FWE49_00735 [Synergistaceae bacterium]|nr:hypothetical protein [Synergistaceae bacterium]